MPSRLQANIRELASSLRLARHAVTVASVYTRVCSVPAKENENPSSGDLNQDPQVALADMISAINDLAEIKQRTGMDQPTVIT